MPEQVQGQGLIPIPIPIPIPIQQQSQNQQQNLSQSPNQPLKLSLESPRRPEPNANRLNHHPKSTRATRAVTSPNKVGAQGRNRTNHTWIFSPLLYRLSYLGKPRRDHLGQSR